MTAGQEALGGTVLTALAPTTRCNVTLGTSGSSSGPTIQAASGPYVFVVRLALLGRR